MSHLPLPAGIRVLTTLSMLAVLLSGASAPLAQDVPIERPPDPLERSIRLGPLELQPFFRIEDFGYDSNVFLGVSGSERSDLTVRLRGGLRGRMPLGNRVVFGFEESPSYTAFRKTSSQNFGANLLSARTDVFLRDLSLFGVARWSVTSQRSISEIDQRTQLRLKEFVGGAGWRPRGRLAVVSTVSSRELRFTDEDFFVSAGSSTSHCGPGPMVIGDLLDRRETGFTIRPSYRALARTRAVVEYSRSRTDFDRCSPRDSDRSAWAAGLEFDPESPLSGSVLAGPARFEAREPGLPDYRGILGKADLGYRPSELWQLKAGWGRDVPFSIIENNIFSIETRVSASVRRVLGSRFAVEAGGDYLTLDWPEPFCNDVGAGPPGSCASLLHRRDRITEGFLGGRMRLSAQADLSIRLAWRQRSSNQEGAEDSRFTVLTGAAF